MRHLFLVDAATLCASRVLPMLALCAALTACGGGVDPPAVPTPPAAPSVVVDPSSSPPYRDTRTFFAGKSVVLAANLPALLSAGSTVQWTLIARPAGSAAEVTTRSGTTLASIVTDVVGVYTVHAVVETPAGRSAPTQFEFRAVPPQIQFVADLINQGNAMLVRVRGGLSPPSDRCIVYGPPSCAPVSVHAYLDSQFHGELTRTDMAFEGSAAPEPTYQITIPNDVIGARLRGLRIVVNGPPPVKNEAFVNLFPGGFGRVGVVGPFVYTTELSSTLSAPLTARVGETVTLMGNRLPGTPSFLFWQRPDGSATSLKAPFGDPEPVRTFVPDRPGSYTIEYRPELPHDGRFEARGLVPSTYVTVVASL